MSTLRSVEFCGDMVNLLAVGSGKPRVQQYKKSDRPYQARYT